MAEERYLQSRAFEKGFLISMLQDFPGGRICSVRRMSVILFFLFFTLTPKTAAALSLSFAWDANTDYVEGYRLYYRMQGESYDYSEPEWEGDETTCTIRNLDNGGVHFFVLRAYNVFGESVNSRELRWPQRSGGGGGGGGCLIKASRGAFRVWAEERTSDQ